MTLPLEENYVIRELLDVSFKASACREEKHGHKEKLAEPGVTLTVDFDLGVNQDAVIEVLTYSADGASNRSWKKIVSVTNNGDGTLTCVFEDKCPVAFCVIEEGEIPPKTVDRYGEHMDLWIALMAASTVGIVGLSYSWRKFQR